MDWSIYKYNPISHLSIELAPAPVFTIDVPDFAVVVGNPAKIANYRFDAKTMKEINKSDWWVHDFRELIRLDEITQPFCIPSREIKRGGYYSQVSNEAKMRRESEAL